MTRALAAIALLVVFGGAAHADITRYAVIIGANDGDADEPSLRFAERDAERVSAALRELGGFRAENVVVALGDSAGDVRRALIAVNDRIRLESRPGRQSMLLVYYSGHGDARSLHLGGSRFELAQLEQLVRGSAATVRLLIVDACRSGGLTRVKGGTLAPPVDIVLDEQLAGDGVVFLTSSSANEDAHESDALGGSFFTHYFVSGLLGAADADGDGRVVLEEAYRHAYDNTLRASSRTLSGTQHPTFHYDLRGRGDIVLTVVAGARRSVLEFPRGRAFLVFAGDANGAVVAEVGARDHSRRIAVRPGRYFVRGRGRRSLLEGTVRVTDGQTLRVDTRDLERIAYARLVRKGGVLTRSHALAAGYRVHSSLIERGSPCQGAFVAYDLVLPHLTLAPRLGVCHSTFDNPDVAGNVDVVDAELRMTHAWDRSFASIDIGAAAGIAVLTQRFDSDNPAPSRATVAGTLGVVGAVSADVTAGYFVVGDVASTTYFASQQDSMSGDSSVRATVVFRAGIGMGKRW